MINLMVFLACTGISGGFMWAWLQPITTRQRVTVPTTSILTGLAIALTAPLNEQTAIWIVAAFSLPWLSLGVYALVTANELAGLEERFGQLELRTEAVGRPGVQSHRSAAGEQQRD